ncbi:MAG: YHS domain-containing protein [Roseimicrobium sp.]
MFKQPTLLALVFAMVATAQAAPVNTTCPVGSRPIRTDITSNYQGKVVAFCCNKCKAKFDANPAQFGSKIK